MDNEQVAEITTPEPKGSPEMYRLIRQQAWLFQRVGALAPMVPVEQRVLAIAEQHARKKDCIYVPRYKSPRDLPQRYLSAEEATMAVFQDWGAELIDRECRLVILETMAKFQ